MASSHQWKVCHWRLSRHFHPFFLDLDHCSKHLLQPLCSMASSPWWSMKGLSSAAWSPFPSIFFGLGVTIEAAKPNCVLPMGEDGSLYKNRSSSKLIVMKNQWNTALMVASVVSIMQTPAIPLWFPKKWLFGFFILKKQLASQIMFLVKSKLSITTHLFFVFYRSTTSQSRSFLKNINNFLCK